MKKTIILTLLAVAACTFNVAAADAKANYEKQCAKCHGADGKGDTKMGKKLGVKDYTDAKNSAALSDPKAFKAVKEGLKEGDKTLMKPFGDVLSDDEIKALITHMQSFKK